jgi:hypothetical protein
VKRARLSGLCGGRGWLVPQRGEIEDEGRAKRGTISVRPGCSHRDRKPGAVDRVPGMDLPETATAHRRVVCSSPFTERRAPQSSTEMVNSRRPYVDACIENFDANRYMFEGNFPVDKALAVIGCCSMCLSGPRAAPRRRKRPICSRAARQGFTGWDNKGDRATAPRSHMQASFMALPALSTTPTQNMKPWLTPS